MMVSIDGSSSRTSSATVPAPAATSSWLVGVGEGCSGLCTEHDGGLVRLGVLAADAPHVRAIGADAFDLDVGSRLRHEDGGSDAQLPSGEGCARPALPLEAITMPVSAISPVSSPASWRLNAPRVLNTPQC